MIRNARRQHAPFARESLTNQLSVAIFEPLDDHEQHKRESSRSRPWGKLNITEDPGPSQFETSEWH
jgi:hypothetical protein